MNKLNKRSAIWVKGFAMLDNYLDAIEIPIFHHAVSAIGKCIFNTCLSIRTFLTPKSNVRFVSSSSLYLCQSLCNAMKGGKLPWYQWHPHIWPCWIHHLGGAPLILISPLGTSWHLSQRSSLYLDQGHCLPQNQHKCHTLHPVSISIVYSILQSEKTHKS